MFLGMKTWGHNKKKIMCYFEIGVFQIRNEVNIGTLWRSAYQLGANGIFTIGKRYKKQASDTYNSTYQIPLRHYLNWEDFYKHRPIGAMLIGIEIDENAKSLKEFMHPKCAIYLLGSEDNGLPKRILEQCQEIVCLDYVNRQSYNVAVAGSIVMYDRVITKGVK